MSDVKLPCKIEPWDGRVVDANDMYVDSDYVLRCVNNHDRLKWLLSQIVQDLPVNRDWLDPEIEGEARALLKELEVDQ